MFSVMPTPVPQHTPAPPAHQHTDKPRGLSATRVPVLCRSAMEEGATGERAPENCIGFMVQGLELQGLGFWLPAWGRSGRTGVLLGDEAVDCGAGVVRERQPAAGQLAVVAAVRAGRHQVQAVDGGRLSEHGGQASVFEQASV